MRSLQAPAPLPPGWQVQTLSPAGNGMAAEASVRLAYREFVPAGGDSLPVVLLLHGSPMASACFDGLAPVLGRRFRVLVPDLPGFGASRQALPDYSIRAHAGYLLHWLQQLGIERAHIAGYSMGGGVATTLAHLAPERVASLSLLSAIGVQELELLGSYQLNQAVHGLQLVALWLLHEATPHFGLLDGFLLNVPYARNFFDSDQRPLRGYLSDYPGAMLIQHGRDDGLVPFAVAEEHHRLVPQSELIAYDGGHGLVFGRWQPLAADLGDFIERVEAGRAHARSTADSARVRQAAQPYDPIRRQPPSGIALLVILVLLALATLISEDLACIGAGLLVAHGTLGFWSAAIACLAGIYIGDLGLYGMGRLLGRPALRRAPLRWFVREADIVRSSQWFARQGPKLILASRFLPGSRLPAYVAAGMLHTRFWTFSLFFLLAAILWTPLLVALSAVAGSRLFEIFGLYQHFALATLAGVVLLLFVALKLALPALTWKGRRLLLSAWRRKTRWEFWPPWLFYLPVFCYVLYLGLKHRSLTLFTLANPGMPFGGLVGESKAEILRQLAGSPDFVARFELLPGTLAVAEKVARAHAFMARHRLGFPVVVKPDRGERGRGVHIVREAAALPGVLAAAQDLLVQEYVPGREFGVFYLRYPDAATGSIFSITDKRLLTLTGDGRRDLETLILADDRAVCMARTHLQRHEGELARVPAAGEVVRLVELGTHCRGALFLDGARHRTAALTQRIDAISRGYPGFCFGRFDIRAPEVGAFERGEQFKIVELNGVTSEAAHIYDPANSLWLGWRTICRQWRIAFEIGAQHRARGQRPPGLRAVLRQVLRARQG